MKPLAAALLAGLLLLAGAVPAGAQHPGAVRFERVASSAGLSHNSIYAITQDREGFLWIGTVDGLNRYDGYTFTVYRNDPDDPASLSNNLVHALLEDRSGALWVGTGDGLCRLDRRRERFVRYPLPPPAQPGGPETVASLYEDRAGTVWAATTLGLYRFDRTHDRFVVFPHALRYPAVSGVQEDGAGRLWILNTNAARTASLLYRYDPRTDRLLPFDLPADWTVFTTFLIDADDRFWLTTLGPARADTATGRVEPPADPVLPAAPTNLPPWALHRDRSGRLWVGFDNGLFAVDPATGQRTYYRPDPAPTAWLQNFVRSIYEDRSGTLWIGTHGGLYRADPHAKPFVVLRHDPANPGSLSSSFVSAVYAAPAGVRWVGTFGGGLNRVDPGGHVVRYQGPGAQRNRLRDIIWTIHADARGTLWLGTEGGLYSFDPGAGRFTPHDLLPGHYVQLTFLAQDSDGFLWAASRQGLFRYDPRRRAVTRYPQTGDRRGPSGDGLESLLFEPPGTLWIGPNEQVLNRLDLATGVFTHYPLATTPGARLHSEGIWTIHRSDDGSLWLGTGSGLIRFDPRTETFTHYTQRDGLPGSVVYGIEEDGRGHLWVGTNLGLSRFDPQAPPGTAFRTFDAGDGIGNTEFNRHASFAGPDGRLYFGGLDGLTTFDPAQIRDNPFVPPVVLTRIQTASREQTRDVQPFGLDRLVLSYRDYSLDFEFAALSFSHPLKNRYAYRLDGFDANWVEAGTRRFARYTNLPAGDYVFRVRGSNNDGVWNEAGATLRLTVRPPFWENAWFRLLVLALAAALLTAAYRYRVHRLLEVERLRLRIASDLHDDFSSDLSGIALVTDLVRRRPGLSEQDRRQLAEAHATTLRMIDGLRDVVWYMNPRYDTLEGLVLRMHSVAATLLHGLDFQFEPAPEAPAGPVSMAFRQNLFLIYKEALHNIARHARARHVRILFTRRDGGLLLRITDDGVGFDPTLAGRGDGLRNMRARAAQLGAVLQVESGPGRGTTLSLALHNREFS